MQERTCSASGLILLSYRNDNPPQVNSFSLVRDICSSRSHPKHRILSFMIC